MSSSWVTSILKVTEFVNIKSKETSWESWNHTWNFRFITWLFKKNKALFLTFLSFMRHNLNSCSQRRRRWINRLFHRQWVRFRGFYILRPEFWLFFTWQKVYQRNWFILRHWLWLGNRISPTISSKAMIINLITWIKVKTSTVFKRILKFIIIASKNALSFGQTGASILIESIASHTLIIAWDSCNLDRFRFFRHAVNV